MELEVGVRITRDAGDLTFASTETEAIFILAAHLPGFTKDEIDVAMIDGENRISIRGGGHIACQEAVITSRVNITREVSVESFDEAFPVPDSVDWDGIDAWFDEEEKILIISIPKLLTNECSGIGEEETAEHPIQEKRQVCKELVREETEEQIEEEDGESELQGLKRPHKVKEQQTPEGIPHLPPMPGESIGLPPAEHLQPGAADEEDKIVTPPQYPESKEYLQIMQVAAERLDQEEEEDEAAQHITPRGKKPMQTEVKMAAFEDDFTASEKVCAAPKEFKKPAEGTEAETPKIAEYGGSEAPKRELYPSKIEAREHKIPRIDKPHETKKPTETPKQRPMQEQVAIVLPQPREPWHVMEVQQKYKTLDVTKPETREPPKIKGTAQQLHPPREDEQNQKKPRVKGPDQVLETEQLIQSKKEYEDIQIEEHREIKREKPQVKTADEALEAELIESEKMTELSNEQDEEKLTGRTEYDKAIAEEWPEIRKSEVEFQGTKEDEQPKLTSPDIEKRASIETKERSQDVHQNEEKIKQCHEMPTEKPSQLIKEVAKQRRSEEKAEKEMHQPEEEGSKENKNLTEERPYEKPKTEKLPEPKEPHQKDRKPPLDTPDQVMEAKHPTKSKETEEEIQKQEQEEQEHEKPATVQKYEKPKAARLPEKEPKERLHVFKEDEDRQLKGPYIEAFRTRESLKPKEFSLETEKPTSKAPKEMLVAVEPKTEKEEKVEPELQQPEEHEVQEQKTPTKLSPENIRTIKFQEPKEPEQKHEKTRVSAPEQILEAAQHIQSELDEELKQHEHEVQEDKEPLVVTACELPTFAELPQKEEPKPQVHEFHEDVDHQWMGPDREASKTRMSLELEKKYKDLQQEEEVMKHKAEKPTEKTEFEVAESTKSGEKGAKKEVQQPEEQETQEYKPIIQPLHEEGSAKKLSEPKKPVQVHEKLGVRKADQILKDARHIQEQQLQAQKKEDETKSPEPHQSKERQREIQSVMPTYNEEIKKEIQQSADEESFKHKIIVKSQEKFPKLIKPEKEVQKPILETEVEESVIAKQKLYQAEEEEEPKPQVFSILKKPETEAVLETQELENNQESKYQKPPEELAYQASEITKLIGLEEQESEEKETPVHKKLEPRKTKKKEEQQREQLSRKPTNQVETTWLVSEAEKDNIPIAETLEIKGVLESQEPYKKPEESLHVEAELQLKLPKEIEARDRACPTTGAELLDKPTVEPLERESQTKDVEHVTEFSIPQKQPPKSKQPKELEGPRLQQFREEEAQQQLEQQKKPQVKGPDKVLEIEQLMESKKLYEDKQIEAHKGIKCEKPEVKTLDEVLEAEHIDTKRVERELPNEQDEEKLRGGKTYKKPIAAEWQETRKPKIKLQGTKEDEEPKLTGPDIGGLEKGASKEGSEDVHQKEEKMKLKAAELPELKQWLHEFKEDEDRQLKGPDIEASGKRASLKPKELSLDLQRPEIEKPTMKAPKEILEAAEAIKTEKEEKEVEPELQKSEEEAQKQKMHIEGLSHEETRTMKFKEPKEPGQEHEKTRVCELEQVLEAAQHIKSEQDKELKQYEQEVQKDNEPITVPACEKPKAVELPQKEDPKPQVHEFNEDEDHQWIGPDKETPKIRMSLVLEETYKDLQQKEIVMKQKAEKPTKKAHEQLLEVAEQIKPGEKEEKKEVQQPEEQETQKYNKSIIQPPHEESSSMKLPEPKKPVQVHEKLGVKANDQILKDAQQIQSEDIKAELQQQEDEVQEHEFTLAPTYEMMEKEELKPALHVLKEDEDNQWKIPDIETPKIRESRYLHQEQVKKKQKTEKPSDKAPGQILKVEEPTQHEEKEAKRQLEEPEGQEPSECRKPTLHSSYEKHDTTQSAEPKEADQKHKPKVRELAQVLKAEKVQSKELDEGLKQQKQEVQEHEKPIIVPTCEKPQVTPPDQVLENEEHFQPKVQQHEQELQKQEKPTVVPTCEKYKAAEFARKEEPKPQLYELKENTNHQRMGPEIETSPTKKWFKQDEESQLLQQKQEIMKQKEEMPTEKAHKQLGETAEPTQPEEGEKEAKKGPDKPKEQEAQRVKMRGMPTYEEEIEQEFQISAEEGQDHEMIAESQEPEKQEEPVPKQPARLEKESKPMLEHIESEEHQKPAVESLYQTPDKIDFKAPEEQVLPTPKAPEIKGVPKRQEILQKKESEEFEKLITGPPFKTPKIKEFRPLEEQEQELQSQKREKDKIKSPKPHQSKEKVEGQREIQSVMPTYNEEIEKKLQQLADEESFEHEIILKSPENFPKLIKPEKEIKKPMLEKEMEESVIPKQKLFQPKEEDMPTAQAFSILKEPEIETVLETQEVELDKKSKYQEPTTDPPHQASEITKLVGVEEKEAPMHKRLEPGKTKEKEEQQREQPDRKPMNHEETTLLESKAEKDKIPIVEKLEIKGMPESQEPYKKPEESLHVEAELQLKPPGKIEAQERVCPAMGAQLPDKPVVRPTEREAQIKEVEQATESSIPRKQPPESKQPKELKGPRLRLFMEEESKKQPEQQFKQLDEEEAQKIESLPMQELARNGPILKPPDRAARTKALVEAVMEQELYRSKEGELEKYIESPKLQKPPPFPTKLEDRKVPERDETIVEPPKPEPHQSKEKVERQREIQSVMPTYNEEIEKEIQQLADEESFEHEIILKSPENFPKLTKPKKEIKKPMLEKEMEESVIPKQKLFQPEEEDAPTPKVFSILKEPKTEAMLEAQKPEHDKKSKYQELAKEPSYQASETTKLDGLEEQESQEKEALVHKRLKPGKTKEKEEQQREQLNRKPTNHEETTLLKSEAEKDKIPIAEMLEIKGMPESQEPYKKPEESLHVEAELKLKPPNKIEAHERMCPAVGAQLPDKPAVGPTEREAQTKEVEQATEFSIPQKQPPESKQPKELEGPRLRVFMEEESKEQSEQQFKQPDEEEAQKIESLPTQELAHNGSILEPPDQVAHTKALVAVVMEQELYRSEEGELEKDIESPKLQKPPPFPTKLEDRKVQERDETIVEPPKPPPIIRGAMETERSPLLLSMEEEATETPIPPPRLRGAMQPEGSPLPPSPDEEAIEREFPALIQKELHPDTDLQKPEEQKTASRQMPDFEESAAGKEGKTIATPAPHKPEEEIQRPSEEVPHKILEVPHPMKICELEHKLYAPKEIEEEQEENPPPPLEHGIKTLEEEVSGDEAEASGTEMNKCTKMTNLRRRRRFHCRCRDRRPAFPIPPSTLLSGSGFVFSIMVLVFHFIKGKNPN